jgi:hypothetical protein
MDADALNALVDRTEAANQAWVRGDWDSGYGAFLTDSVDASIYGPFGGELMTGANWKARGPQAVQQFSDGQSRLRVLRTFATDDLVVLVTLEEQTATIAGSAEQPWSLRVTQVYRREHGEWKVVHRHADPLVRPRSMAETLALIEK